MCTFRETHKCPRCVSEVKLAACVRAAGSALALRQTIKLKIARNDVKLANCSEIIQDNCRTRVKLAILNILRGRYFCFFFVNFALLARSFNCIRAGDEVYAFVNDDDVDDDDAAMQVQFYCRTPRVYSLFKMRCTLSAMDVTNTYIRCGTRSAVFVRSVFHMFAILCTHIYSLSLCVCARAVRIFIAKTQNESDDVHAKIHFCNFQLARLRSARASSDGQCAMSTEISFATFISAK